MPPLTPPAVATAPPSPSQQLLHPLFLTPLPSSASLVPLAGPLPLEAEAAPASSAAPVESQQSQSATRHSPRLSLSSLSRRLSLLMRRRASSSSSSSSQESSPSSVEATSTPAHPYTNSAGPLANGSSLSLDYGTGSRRQSLFRRLSLSRRSSGSSPGGSQTPSPPQAPTMVQRQQSSSPRPENAPALAKSASGFRGRRGHRHDGGAGPSPLSVGGSSTSATTSPTTASPDKLRTIRAAAASPRGATGDPTYLDTALWRPLRASLDSVAAPFVTAPAAERDRADGGKMAPEGATKELEEFEAAARAAAASHRPPEPRVKRGLFRKLSRGLLVDSTESGAGGSAGSVGLNEPFRRRRSVLNMAWSPPRGTADGSPGAAADQPKPTGPPRTTRSPVNGSATVSRWWLKNAPPISSSEGVGAEVTRHLGTDVDALTDTTGPNVLASIPTSAPVAGPVPYMDFSKLAAPSRDLDEACAVEHAVVRPLLPWRHYDDEEGFAGIFLAPRIPRP